MEIFSLGIDYNLMVLVGSASGVFGLASLLKAIEPEDGWKSRRSRAGGKGGSP